MQVDNATANHYYLQGDVEIAGNAANVVIADSKLDNNPTLRRQLGVLVAAGDLTVDTEPVGYVLDGGEYVTSVDSWSEDPDQGADNTGVAAVHAAATGLTHTVTSVTASYDDPTGTGEMEVYDGANGVLSGCAVAENGVPDLDTVVAAGVVVVDGVRTTVAGNSVTHDAAHATLDRIDIVVVDDGGTATEVAGTPAATPAAPAVPSGFVLLAQVSVPALDTAITNSQITNSVKTTVTKLHRQYVHGAQDVDRPMKATAGNSVAAWLEAGGAGIGGKVSMSGTTA